MLLISRTVIGAVAALMLVVPAQAQTTEECMAELRKVQAFIENSGNPDSTPNQNATDRLLTAEVSASEGNGPRCMEFVEEAKGASGYHD